jgi:23S rRNA (guanosine2251-2'-O)-methyltransferase
LVVAQRIANTVVPSVPRRQLSVVLDNVRSAHNVGVIFRTAEAVGVSHIYLCGITAPGDHVKVAKAALGSQLRVRWSHHVDAFTLVTSLRSQGREVWALESVAGANDIFSIGSAYANDITVVVGNEIAGVDPAVVAVCDRTMALPMIGSKNSLNVGHAFAVAAYHIAFATG